MTNDKFKPTFKKPFIPQTETRIFLGGRPIDQQTEPTSSKGVNKQHYQSERVNEVNPSYGPCYVCSKSEAETNLRVACPVPSCTGKTPGYWYHNKDGCRNSFMKVSNRGNLRCSNCSTSGKIGYWLFICSDHGGTPEYATSGAFKRALSIVLGSEDCDEVITDLGAYIADPKHKNEWFS
jgi:hypothetical protein